MPHRILTVFLVSVLLVSAVFPLSGCGNDEAARLKLDPVLRQLIDAERRGEAESLAQSASLIDLVDGAVDVAIYAEPGQLEAAVKAVAKYGTVEHVSETAELVGALVPIVRLTALARQKSIRNIRLPARPDPK